MTLARIAEEVAVEVGKNILSAAPGMLANGAQAVAQSAGAFVAGPGGTVVVAAPKLAAAAGFVAAFPVLTLTGVAVVGVVAVAALSD
ncbi:MAG: hypothetical protein AAFR17_08035 [Pseudomonadota bacterium]